MDTLELATKLQIETIKRLRWRLWFVFAESKYDAFRVDKNKKKPNWHEINKYCREHWGKEIGDMTEAELAKYISIVKKWK
jgi:hypothetical protein